VAHLTRVWADYIATTPLSLWFQTQLWVVPTSQSLHIAALSVVFACALLINLRLLGTSVDGRSILDLVRTLGPWMYGALALLLITGTVQTITEPVRQFVTPAFWWKMAMVVVAFILTVLFHRSVRRHPDRWDRPGASSNLARLLALTSLALWIAIVICGRLIGYTWEEYV
jgi:hypothetical protein